MRRREFVGSLASEAIRGCPQDTGSLRRALQAGRFRIKNFCHPSSTSSRRWLYTVLCNHDTRGAACRQLGHLQRGIDRVVGIDGFQEPARLFEKADEGILDQKRKQARARRGVDQRLEAMRQQVRHAAGAAIFDIVVDRMSVAACGLEGREDRRCLRAARQDKTLAEHEILKPALRLHHAVRGGIEVGHGGGPPARQAMQYRYRGAGSAAIGRS
jgi:hypothetical protein